MGWYNEAWQFRTALTINNHSGVNSPECEFTIPTALGKFWDNVLSNFNDVRITRADGVTALDFAFDGTPSKTNKTATIQVDDTNHNVNTLYGNQGAAANASVGMFMYWGNDEQNLASGVNNSTNVTSNSAKVVDFSLAQAGSAAHDYMLNVSPAVADQVYPTHRIRKQVADDLMIYFNLSSAVSRLRRISEGSNRDEEIAYAKVQIFDQDGNDTTSAMCDLSRIAIGDDYTVAVPIRAGTHEKRYLIIMTFGLVSASGIMRVIDERATLLVNNLGLHPS